MAPVPPATVRVARAAFPKGTPSLTLRDALGPIFQDDNVADLYSREGHPGLAPWHLALVTVRPFREHLADRQAAEAVRARLDWKYLLGLELTAPGLHCSVLSEFRDRLVPGEGGERLRETLVRRCRELGLLKARGQQRTDAPHVFAAIRGLTRLELLGATLRATLNDLAPAAPDWRHRIAPLAWDERYGQRLEDMRFPKAEGEREADAQQVGTDGFALLEALAAPEMAQALGARASGRTWRPLWSQPCERMPSTPPTPEGLSAHPVRVKPPRA